MSYLALFALASIMIAPADVSPVEPAQAMCYFDPDNPVGSASCVVMPPVNCALRTYKAILTGQSASCPMP